MQTEADRKLFKKGRKDLKDRVWDVLVAIDRDPQLRERFFAEASAPVNCADAGAQVFNKLGIETLLADILQDSTEQGLATRDNKLVELAWQTWRLKQLNEFAKQDIIRRTQPVAQGGLGLGFGSGALEVDEVQVYLAYQTGLKTRLDLPWLSEHMAYRNTAKVTRDQLDAAYQSVISAAANDGAVKGCLIKTSGAITWKTSMPINTQRDDANAMTPAANLRTCSTSKKNGPPPRPRPSARPSCAPRSCAGLTSSSAWA